MADTGRAERKVRHDGCPLCASALLIQRHCKLLCTNCGYVESCEDIFPVDRYADQVDERLTRDGGA